MDNINRCQMEGCKKKIKLSQLITNKCKCENIYCNQHRLPKKHKCTFDFFNDLDKSKQIERMKCVAILEKI